MNLDELTKLDELRTALSKIDAQFQAAHITLDLVRTKVTNSYYAACAAMATPKEKMPRSMQVSVPDAAYAWGCGDKFAQIKQ